MRFTTSSGRVEQMCWDSRTHRVPPLRTVYSAAILSVAMTAFDPEKFEDKYVHYFDEL